MPHLSHVRRGLGTEVEEQRHKGVGQAALQVPLDVGSLAGACGAHQQAVLAAAHQLVYEEGVAHSVHGGDYDVGVLSISWDGGGVQQLPPWDPLELGLVKGEAVHCLAIWEDLCDLDGRCLQKGVLHCCRRLLLACDMLLSLLSKGLH